MRPGQPHAHAARCVWARHPEPRHSCQGDHDRDHDMATIIRSHDIMGDRYKYDFRQCKLADGWAQLDTRQDASYYGNWINPLTLKLASYCEGDVTMTECTDEADFIATVREYVSWHQERNYFIGIDGGCSEPIIESFRRMGLDEYLH